MKKKFLILYNRAIDNVVISNKIIYKLWSIEERYQEKLSTLQSGDIVLCIYFFLHLEETLMLYKTLQKNYLGKIQEFFSLYKVKKKQKLLILSQTESPLETRLIQLRFLSPEVS